MTNDEQAKDGAGGTAAQRPGYRPGDLTWLYHLNSSVSRCFVPDALNPAGAEPPRWDGEARTVSLDRGTPLPGSLEEALRLRFSQRELSGAPLPVGTVASLLESCCALRTVPGRDPVLPPGRPAPSAGGLHPLETYVLSRAVEGLENGIYHYRPQTHELAVLQAGDPVPALADLCFGQSYLAQANLVVSFTTVPGRGLWKYGERCYRYALLEAGHVAQNLLLAATALGLAAVPVGGFFDAEVNRLLDLDESREQAVYHVAVGAPGSRSAAGAATG